MYKNVINQIRGKTYTKENVDEAAKMILGISGNISKPPVKIIEICQSMDFSVYQQQLPENICGYIMINGELKDKFKTDRIISVNAKESNKRRRFTVAHELGHFLFDFNPNNSIEYFNMFEIDHVAGDLSEDRANRFAAELLMPKDAIIKHYKKIEKNSLYDIVQQLSDIFLVPPKAVEVRLKEELGLI